MNYCISYISSVRRYVFFNVGIGIKKTFILGQDGACSDPQELNKSEEERSSSYTAVTAFIGPEDRIEDFTTGVFPSEQPVSYMKCCISAKGQLHGINDWLNNYLFEFGQKSYQIPEANKGQILTLL